ncbi:hypothetical protein [uncultured Gilliamella sp.]|uniref:hypothetical protein n=1 Tax=uncultured Gilliamella sp. TaxID=1193505 RepID=UPI0025CB8359|nr:hypothetical protein [uncultured Gilliamella sp.]
MKKCLLVLLCSIMMLTACAKKNYIVQGSPLSKEKVNLIFGGFTDETELVNMFGEPTTKKVLNDKETLWTFEYLNKSSVSHILIDETLYVIEKRKLEVIISKGIVTRFNYEENIDQKKW